MTDSGMNVVERGSGTPILLLHGFDADHRLVLPLEAAFSPGPAREDDGTSGWRRLYPDLPGFGRTPIGDAASTDDVVERVLTFIDETLGDEKFAILGDSFGGMIARAIAHRRREQVLGLGLLASVFVADSDARDTPSKQVMHEDADAVKRAGDAAEAYEAIAVVQSEKTVRNFLEFAAPGTELADKEAMKRLSENYELSVQPEDGAPFEQPCVIITGRQDHLVGYRDAWARLEHYPHATFVTLDAAGHNAHHERPDLVTAVVADWLRRMRGPLA